MLILLYNVLCDKFINQSLYFTLALSCDDQFVIHDCQPLQQLSFTSVAHFDLLVGHCLKLRAHKLVDCEPSFLFDICGTR